MPATDEIRRAAAELRKAAQLQRDEQRGLQSELGKAKSDHDMLIYTLKAEQTALKQQQAAQPDPNKQNDVNRQVGDLDTRLIRYKDDHDHQVRELEQRIGELDQQIHQYEQEAAQLENQAT